MNSTLIGAALMLSFALAAWPQFPALADRGQNGKDQKDGVQPLFGLTTPPDGPFPCDRFTKRDEAQNTCEQVDLPIPDCTNASSKCFETRQLNLLDGFNTRPRISIPFDGDIDPNTVNSENIFLVSLGDSMIDGAPGCLSAAVQSDDRERLPPQDASWKVGIDQAVWDPASKTLAFESDELLNERRTTVGLQNVLNSLVELFL